MLTLTLYFCLLQIELNNFSLIIVNSNRSRLHLMNIILYHNRCEWMKMQKTYLTLEHLLTFADSYESTKVDESAKVYTSVNVV